jgi:hypothetical protein
VRGVGFERSVLAGLHLITVTPAKSQPRALKAWMFCNWSYLH